MTARHYAAILFASMLLSCLNCPAEARPSEARQALVTPALVCQVQHAIRWREPAWVTSQCERVAAALNETPNSLQMFAVAINESDLRPSVIHEARPGVYDVGLAGVRCVTRTMEEDTRDLCLNGPARGFTLKQLQNPATNIRIAAAVLASHGGSLRRYNGGTREHGYGARIGAIVAALGGVDVFTKKRDAKKGETRMEKLTRQILGAAKGEPRS